MSLHHTNTFLNQTTTDIRILIEPQNPYAHKVQDLYAKITNSYFIPKFATIRHAYFYNFFDIHANSITKIVSMLQAEIPNSFVYYNIEDLLSNKEPLQQVPKHLKKKGTKIKFFDYVALEPNTTVLDEKAISIQKCLNIANIAHADVTSGEVIFIYELIQKSDEQKNTDALNKIIHTSTNLSDTDYKNITQCILHPHVQITNIEKEPSKENYNTEHNYTIDNASSLSQYKISQILSDNGSHMNIHSFLNVAEQFENENKALTIVDLKILDLLWQEQLHSNIVSHRITDVKFSQQEDEAIERTWNTYLQSKNKSRKQDSPVTLQNILLLKRKKTPSIPINFYNTQTKLIKEVAINLISHESLILCDTNTNNKQALSTSINNIITKCSHMLMTSKFDSNIKNTQTHSNFDFPLHDFTKQQHKSKHSFNSACSVAIHKSHTHTDIEVNDIVALIGPTDKKSLLSKKHKHIITEKNDLYNFFTTSYCAQYIKKINSFENKPLLVRTHTLLKSTNYGIKLIIDKIQKLCDNSCTHPNDIISLTSHNYFLCIISPDDLELLSENTNTYALQVVPIGSVSENTNIQIYEKTNCIANVSKNTISILDTQESTQVFIKSPKHAYAIAPPWYKKPAFISKDFWLAQESNIKNFIQKIYKKKPSFDDTSKSKTVLLSHAGIEQCGLEEGMAVLFPLPPDVSHTENFKSQSICLLTLSYCPVLSQQSPFHAASYTIIDTLNKIACMGGNPFKTQSKNQLFFDTDTNNFSEALASTLGVFDSQHALQLQNLHTQINTNKETKQDTTSSSTEFLSFGIGITDIQKIKSTQITQDNLYIYILTNVPKTDGSPNYSTLKSMWQWMLDNNSMIENAHSIESDGFLLPLVNMCLGNKMGCDISFYADLLFTSGYGSVIITCKQKITPPKNIELTFLGKTTKTHALKCNVIEHGSKTFNLHKLYSATSPDLTLQTVLQAKKTLIQEQSKQKTKQAIYPAYSKKTNLNICIPNFTQTQGVTDLTNACTQLGANCISPPLLFDTQENTIKSLSHLEQQILLSKILILGNSHIADPWNVYDNTGYDRFLTFILQHKKIVPAISELLHKDGLILGIGSGFRALVHSGWLPFNQPHSDIEHRKSPYEHSLFFKHTKQTLHFPCMIRTKYQNIKTSPWLSLCKEEHYYWEIVSHRTGKLIINTNKLPVNTHTPTSEISKIQTKTRITLQLQKNKQIVSTYRTLHNEKNIEGLCSPDGKILGKLSHIERCNEDAYKNIPGYILSPILHAGINYFN